MGQILGVRGSEARVALPAPVLLEQSRATVGAFLRISAGPRRLIGMITEVESSEPSQPGARGFGAIARVDLMGEIVLDGRDVASFARGVSIYPAIGDPADIIGQDELRLIYANAGEPSISIGSLHHDDTIEARVSLDNMLTKHFAILGSTGVGKSCGVSVILNEILDARPKLRIFLLDGHNEFGRCFGARANVINASNFKLPFWLFKFEEFVDVLYGGHASVDEELDILAEHIPVAKGMYLLHRIAQDRNSVRRVDPRRAGYTVDTPVPYVLQDLINLIDERMGKLENRATRMHYHRLLARIETLRSDARFGFMFENANVGGDTMGEILTHLFRLEPNGQPMTVMQVAGLPVEVVDAVVCVVCRLAFDFGLWSDGAMPMLFVCEEAHRFAPADRTVGFAPTRRALLRIAKEGRKYGVYLGLVTQRPAELDPTIISQCNTLFAMRMANDRDQALLRSAVDRRGREPAGLRAFARHARGRRLRRRSAAAGAPDLQGVARRPRAAQRNLRARRLRRWAGPGARLRQTGRRALARRVRAARGRSPTNPRPRKWKPQSGRIQSRGSIARNLSPVRRTTAWNSISPAAGRRPPHPPGSNKSARKCCAAPGRRTRDPGIRRGERFAGSLHRRRVRSGAEGRRVGCDRSRV